jgi:quercetin dioxygenase-like cupin family protein
MMSAFKILPFSNDVVYKDCDLSVRGFTGGRCVIETDGTTFFVVVMDNVTIECFTVDRMYVSEGMYGCAVGPLDVRGSDCRVMLVTAKRYRGIYTLGGPVEETGRLKYIDGCTDTGLIQPLRLGDPCLNALYFPAGTRQTAHMHPSHRVGVVLYGEGICETPISSKPMRAGDMFIIPAGSVHRFITQEYEMRIVAFHPDSEFGPTDERHQMLKATIIESQRHMHV